MARVDGIAHVKAIARSYLEEAVYCYVADHTKASAVMVGAAAESVVLELRDAVETKLEQLQKTVPKDLTGWRIARVLQALRTIFYGCRGFEGELGGLLERVYPANPCGSQRCRPSLKRRPITPDAVNASLLIFPELLRLADALRSWVVNNMT